MYLILFDDINNLHSIPVGMDGMELNSSLRSSLYIIVNISEMYEGVRKVSEFVPSSNPPCSLVIQICYDPHHKKQGDLHKNNFHILHDGAHQPTTAALISMNINRMKKLTTGMSPQDTN